MGRTEISFQDAEPQSTIEVGPIGDSDSLLLQVSQ